MKQSKSKLVFIGIILLLIAAFFASGLQSHFDLAALQSQRESFSAFYAEHTTLTLAAYVLIYVFVTSLSLPGAAIMTLAGGALFGLWLGTILASIASTVGATLAFLVARYILRESVQNKFQERLAKINEHFAKEGAFYLFTMRLIPAFPFFIINILMGLTPVKVSTFFFVSQIGMLPGTIVFVNAGTQLSQLESLQGILSPSLIVSFALLGFFPLIAKRIVGALQRKRQSA